MIKPKKKKKKKKNVRQDRGLCQQLGAEIRALQHYEGRSGNTSHQPRPSQRQNLPRIYTLVPSHTTNTTRPEPMDPSASRGAFQSRSGPPDFARGVACTAEESETWLSTARTRTRIPSVPLPPR